MKTIFSARERSSTWRELWLWLAEGEKKLGLDISDEAIAQMTAHLKVTDEDLKVSTLSTHYFAAIEALICQSYRNCFMKTTFIYLRSSSNIQ